MLSEFKPWNQKVSNLIVLILIVLEDALWVTINEINDNTYDKS